MLTTKPPNKGQKECVVTKKNTQDVAVASPELAYMGEPPYLVQEVGASCSWQEASRQLAVDAAQELVLEWAPGARGQLYHNAAVLAAAHSPREQDNLEKLFFMQVMTAGSHMKRQRFWSALAGLGRGEVPRGTRLRREVPEGMISGAERALIIPVLTGIIRAQAKAKFWPEKYYRVKTVFCPSTWHDQVRRLNMVDEPQWGEVPVPNFGWIWYSLEVHELQDSDPIQKGSRTGREWMDLR